MVFIGPSGCGKTTLLRLIAGLEPVSEGELWFDDKLMNNVVPGERKIGMVFQHYALYPNMSVYENLSFGLQQKKVDKKSIEQRIRIVAEKLEISHILAEKPQNLSGGQQQRVAIGRCIVQRPQLFLLDEPLSNLDASLRAKTRLEIKKLHKTLKATMIYVTHDQHEAMTLADRIAVFAPIGDINGNDCRQSNLQQVGTPLELYNKPCNRFVAQFLGQPKINFLRAKVVEQSQSVSLFELQQNKHLISLPGCQVNLHQEVELAFRPEHILIGAEIGAEINKTEEARYFKLEAQLQSCEQLGGESILHFLYGDSELVVKVQKQFEVSELQTTNWPIHIAKSHCHVFDLATGLSLKVDI